MRFYGLCLVLLASTANAADTATDRYFRSLDLNGDGYVSLSEAAGHELIVTRFDKGDRNKDGKLSPKEFANLKNVKVRVATRKKNKGEDKDEPSAAVGGTARKSKAKSEAGG